MNSTARELLVDDELNSATVKTVSDYRSGRDSHVIGERGSRKYLLLLEPEFDFLAAYERFPPLRSETDATTAVLVPRVLARLRELENIARARTRKNKIKVRKRLYRHLARELRIKPAAISMLFRGLYLGHQEVVRKLALRLAVQMPAFGAPEEAGTTLTLVRKTA